MTLRVRDVSVRTLAWALVTLLVGPWAIAAVLWWILLALRLVLGVNVLFPEVPRS